MARAFGECRTPFNYDVSEHPGTDFTVKNPKDPNDPSRSRTAQEYRDESDPAKIVKRLIESGGAIDELLLQKREAIYADVTGIGSYFEAKCKTARIENAFMTLDADVRAKFENDPQKMMEFLADPANKNEAIDLGLLPDDSEKVEGKAGEAAAPGDATASQAEAGGAGAAETAETK